MRLIAKLLCGLLIAGAVGAAEVGVYPMANPLTGSERLLADQSSNTVNITPNQIYAWLFPAGYLPASLMPVFTGDCSTSNGSFAITCTKTGGLSFSTLATTPTSTAIVNLFGGCSSALFLGGDGNCHPGGGNGTVTSVNATVPAWLKVTGVPFTTSGTINITSNTASANQVLATPNGSAGNLGVRSLVAADLPQIPLSGGVTGVLPSVSGGSGVAGSLTGILKANGTSPYTTAQVSDVISLFGSGCSSNTYLNGGGGCTTPAGQGTVTSIGVTVPSGFAVSPSSISSNGTFAISYAAGQAANSFLATPSTGTGAINLRTIATADLPSIPLATGVSGNLAVSHLNGGTGATATTAWLGNGTWGAPWGTVSSVGLTAPSIFAVTNSPITGTGNLALSFATGQAANQVLASPNGTTGAVGLRSLVAADIPTLPLTSAVSGILPVINGGTGESGTVTGILYGNGASAHTAATVANVIGLFSGSCGSTTYLRGDGSCNSPSGNVSSVGLQLNSIPWLTVTNSPITSSGSLNLTPASSQAANQFVATPSSGSGAVALRTIAAADLPAISLTTGVTGTLQAAQEPAFTGDVTKAAGSLATTVTAINGGAVPTSTALLATNSAGKLVSATTTGSGSAVLASGAAINLGAATGLPLTTGVTGLLPVANGGTGAATLTGPIKGNGTSAFTAAAASDIVGLFSGTCNASSYLNGAGGCSSPAGAGTVTSVAMSVPSWLTVSGSPITGSGTLAVAGATLGQNLVLATPSNTSGAVSARPLVYGDLPAAGTSTQFVQVSTNTTLSGTQTSVLVNAASGPITITLPTAVGDSHQYYVKKIDSSANVVTVVTSAGQTIDGASSSGVQFQYSAVTFKSDNANWWII